MRRGEICASCGKIVYETYHIALLAAVKHSMEGVPMSPYHSRKCKCFHLSNAVKRTGKLAQKLKRMGQ